MTKRRYITYYGYFGPTSNLKDAPVALTSDAVSRVLHAIPARADRGDVK